MAGPLITPPFQVPFYNPQTRDIDRQWKDYLLFLTRQIAAIFAPIDGSYVVTGNVPGLINQFNLGLLAAGLLKQTVLAGVATPSIAVAGVDYTALAFKTIAVSGQSDVIADSAADLLTLAAGTNITITTNAGTDTITITAASSGGTVTVTGSPSSGDITKFSGGTSITNAVAGTDYTALAFKTIAVSGQSDVVADTPADTLTLAAGSGVTITTNAGTDTVTIAASGGGTVTHTTGALTAGKLIGGNGTDDIKVAVGVTMDSGDLLLSNGSLLMNTGGSSVTFNGGAGTIKNVSGSSGSSISITTADINGSNTAPITIQTGTIAAFGGNAGAVTIDTGSTNSGTNGNVNLGAANAGAVVIGNANGLMKYTGTNTTGGGTALLGTNSPATTNTAPYTWFKMIAADGSTVYIPAWK